MLWRLQRVLGIAVDKQAVIYRILRIKVNVTHSKIFIFIGNKN